MNYYSPLRYPGGKAKLSPLIKELMILNHLEDSVYIEPFAGGAGVALELLFSKYAKKIILNDIDSRLYSFWQLVLKSPEELIHMIETTHVNLDEWLRQKKIFKESENPDELGFSFFFLNRTNRSGILNAGVIGGYNQEGNYKIDARYNKIELIKRIELIADFRSKIDLYNLDTLDLITLLEKSKIDNSFYYFDPPYFNMGKKLYTNFYIDNDHKILSEKILAIKNSDWIVSYDNVSRIKELYSGTNSFEISLQYSATNVQKAKEVIFLSEGLIAPDYLTKAS
jgi:DNA adenine methylase